MSETTIDLPVLGMTCAACVRRVERAVSSLPGVASADVNLPLSRARIVLDPAVANVRTAAAAIREAGYEVPDDVIDAITRGASPDGANAERLAAIARAEQAEVRTLRRDAILAIALTVPLLFIAMAHGLDIGLSPTVRVIVQLVLGTFVVLVPGRHYLRRGWIAVRHRSPDMNTLIALGAGAAWLSSTIVTVLWLRDPHRAHHEPAIYFEAGAAIVAFVMIGKLLESRARARLSDAVRGLMSLAPARARREKGSDASPGDENKGSDPISVAEVDAVALVAGDVIVVRPGERLAADGTIVEGQSALDESMLTGESLPVDKDEGSPVYAGTLNHNGVLRVRVARAGADTALARIARAVEDAQGSKAAIARLADRVSAVFVPIVLAIALATFAGWFVTGHAATDALAKMIAVLVIACPCALGLATPAAVAVGTSRGAELGILFRGGDALERASSIDVVCLDKTGTLTTGHPRLVSQLDDEVLRLAASAEQHSSHPIARAIVDAAKERGLSLARAEHVKEHAGGGLTTTVEGRAIKIGTRDFVGALTTSYAHVGTSASIGAPEGAGAVARSFIVIDGDVRGGIEIADPPSADATATIRALRAMGVEPVMITGDKREAAERVAVEVGIERVHAGVKPTGKAALVEAERERGKHVAMVGDGINDAPALAAADLGVALASGTDIAAAAADVTLLRGGIGALPVSLSLARATMRTIRRNLIAAFVYNAICIPIAAAGLLSPVLASAAMSLSSVSVLASSLRLRRFGRPLHRTSTSTGLIASDGVASGKVVARG